MPSNYKMCFVCVHSPPVKDWTSWTRKKCFLRRFTCIFCGTRTGLKATSSRLQLQWPKNEPYKFNETSKFYFNEACHYGFVAGLVVQCLLSSTHWKRSKQTIKRNHWCRRQWTRRGESWSFHFNFELRTLKANGMSSKHGQAVLQTSCNTMTVW